MRNRAERRKKDYAKIERKRKILRDVYHDELAFTHGKQFHRLSKGKIHCSCPLCATKTKKDGYSHSDLKKLAVAADYEIS